MNKIFAITLAYS